MIDKSSTFRLKGKIAIVSGAANGIGKKIAFAYAEEGVNLALVDINKNELTKVSNKICLKFKNISNIPLHYDLSIQGSIQEMVEKVLEKFGRVDFLVNNAGIGHRSKIEDLNISDWDKILSINLNGVLYCCKEVIPIMKKQGYGKIINASSNMARIPDVGMSAYCVSKAGVEILTKVLASELAPYGINVNAYAPGTIMTEMAKGLISKERREQKLNFVSQRKFGEPIDIANLVLFLSSDLSDYMTGAVIPVDGGLLSTQNPWMAWESIKKTN